MSSNQDYDFGLYLSNINTQIPLIFSYFVPWVGFAIFTFTSLVLIIRKRTEENLFIYLFQWQYAIGVLFWLNMILSDPRFTLRIFGYSYRAASEPVCKLIPMVSKFIYCASPWMQVVIDFCLFTRTNLILFLE